MEQLSMTPLSHAEALRPRIAEPAYRPTIEARDTPEPTLKEMIGDLPPWLTIAAGGVAAAAMGALLGGALHI